MFGNIAEVNARVELKLVTISSSISLFEYSVISFILKMPVQKITKSKLIWDRLGIIFSKFDKSERSTLWKSIFLWKVNSLSIVLEIPVKFINNEDSPGLKKGGVLNIVRRKVELKCPTENIPTELVVDLQGLEIGTSIKISSIKLPENVKPTIQGRDFVIATVAAPTVFKEPEKPATEEGAEGAEAATEGAEAAGAETTDKPAEGDKEEKGKADKTKEEKAPAEKK